jgi:hypothetical protein
MKGLFGPKGEELRHRFTELRKSTIVCHPQKMREG